MVDAPNPPGTFHRVTSEPLKKKNPITVGRAQRDKAPHSRQTELFDIAYSQREHSANTRL